LAQCVVSSQVLPRYPQPTFIDLRGGVDAHQGRPAYDRP